MKNFILKTVIGIFLMSWLTSTMYAASQDPAPQNSISQKKDDKNKSQKQQTNYGMTDYFSS